MGEHFGQQEKNDYPTSNFSSHLSRDRHDRIASSTSARIGLRRVAQAAPAPRSPVLDPGLRWSRVIVSPNFRLLLGT